MSMESLLALFFPFAIALYFLPAMIAYKRQTQYRGYIILVNVLFGWTVLGWLAALLWAILEGQGQERTIQLREPDIIEERSGWTL
jgi:hypothetical protein